MYTAIADRLRRKHCSRLAKLLHNVFHRRHMTMKSNSFSCFFRRRRVLAAAIGGLLSAATLMSGVALAANNSVQGARKTEDGYETQAPTAILVEATTGSVLFEKNADELRAPSSMLKLMTVEVVFDALKRGEIQPTDEYRVSENAWRKGGAPAGASTMFAAIHSRIAVSDLLRGAIIQSGNDSCMVLAENLSGGEKAFAERLTRRARELGMPKSTFGNSTGLPDPENKMTVRELSILARHLIHTYPEQYRLFSEREFTWNKIRQLNRNPLLASFEGADGLKTGYTKEGGYGMVGSAVQNGLRLVVVVNGLHDAAERAGEARKLLEWGFRNFESRTLFVSNHPIATAKVFGGTHGSLDLVSNEPVSVMVQKNGSDKIVARVQYNGPVRAPVAAGQQIGVVKVWRGSNIAVEAPVFAAQSIETGSLVSRAVDGASELTLDLVRTGIGKL